MSWTIEVPLVAPSTNVLRRKYRNPHAYRCLRENWENFLFYFKPHAYRNDSPQRMIREAAERARIRVQVTVYHTKKYDRDNLWGSQKPVLDALRNIGFIKDDSDDWIELLMPQQVIGKERKTVVTLEAL